MSFDFSTLITDRTQADVSRVQELASKIRSGTASESELAEFNSAAMKGAYNYNDLNRVGFAMQYLAERLKTFGYSVNIYPKTDWTELEWPTPSDMDLYLSNLAALRSAFVQMQSTPNVPNSLNKMSIVEANNIEKILEDIDFLLTCSAQGWYFSGDLFSGEV